jgi:FkbM family methyltransferase
MKAVTMRSKAQATRRIRALAEDLANAWSCMPRAQALKWYFNLLRNAPSIVRQKKLYAADARMLGELEFFLAGRRFSFNADAIPGNPFAFFRELILRKIYFRPFDLDRISFNCCVDIGCNQGVVSCVLKHLGGPNARVVGVDAEDFSRCGLQRDNPAFQDMHIAQCLVCGPETKSDSARVRLLASKLGCPPDIAITMSELFAKYSLSQIDFLKMDIEGSEFSVFCEEASWLSHVHNIAMEVHRSIGDPRVIIAVLEANGFETTWRDHFGMPTLPQDCDLIYASKVWGLIESGSRRTDGP